MKKSLLTAACILALSTAGATAQSSQGNTGPGTMNNKSMSDPNARNDSGASNTTTGSSMSNSGMNTNSGGNMTRNPSSQGNAGPGTNMGGSTGGSNMK